MAAVTALQGLRHQGEIQPVQGPAQWRFRGRRHVCGADRQVLRGGGDRRDQQPEHRPRPHRWKLITRAGGACRVGFHTGRGVLLDLSALHPSAEGLRVKFSGGRRSVIEGPFGEPKEIVAGTWILQVKSMDEAIEWAKGLPFEAGGEPETEGEIEIRQLFELEEFGQTPEIERVRELPGS
jgi:hypothetical protein